MTRFASALPALLASLALVLAACGTTAATPSTAASEEPSASASEAAPSEAAPSESEEPETASERVRIDNSVFEPAELTIAAGTKVSFVNADGFAHTVTEGTDGQAADGAIVDEEVQQNGTVSVTFDEPGTYEITCRFHPSMQMTITVEG